MSPNPAIQSSSHEHSHDISEFHTYQQKKDRVAWIKWSSLFLSGNQCHLFMNTVSHCVLRQTEKLLLGGNKISKVQALQPMTNLILPFIIKQILAMKNKKSLVIKKLIQSESSGIGKTR